MFDDDSKTEAAHTAAKSTNNRSPTARVNKLVPYAERPDFDDGELKDLQEKELLRVFK